MLLVKNLIRVISPSSLAMEGWINNDWEGNLVAMSEEARDVRYESEDFDDTSFGVLGDTDVDSINLEKEYEEGAQRMLKDILECDVDLIVNFEYDSFIESVLESKLVFGYEMQPIKDKKGWVKLEINDTLYPFEIDINLDAKETLYSAYPSGSSKIDNSVQNQGLLHKIVRQKASHLLAFMTRDGILIISINKGKQEGNIITESTFLIFHDP